MQIEAEFREVKGPPGLDHLEHWSDRDRVARMPAWVAVYEWRLALLSLQHQRKEWGARTPQIGGSLSWMTITRTWSKRHRRATLGLRTFVRESP